MHTGSEHKRRGRVNWRKIARISQAEIEQQAALEKQRLGIRDEILHTRPVFKCPDIRQLRERLGLSQNQFADRYALSRRTLQQWEQKRSEPDQPTCVFLKAIEKEPDLMAQIIDGLRRQSKAIKRTISK
jgi:putative transcriptional regulator